MTLLCVVSPCRQVYQNEFFGCEYAAIKVQDSPQVICENYVEDPENRDNEVGVASAVTGLVYSSSCSSRFCRSSSSSRLCYGTTELFLPCAKLVCYSSSRNSSRLPYA